MLQAMLTGDVEFHSVGRGKAGEDTARLCVAETRFGAVQLDQPPRDVPEILCAGC